MILGGSPLGVEALASSVEADPPVVNIITPSGTYSSEDLTVTWTYASAVSRPQARYRVKLLLNGGLLHNSDWVESASTSYVVPFVLSSFSTYTVTVELDDLLDIGDDSETFLVQLAEDTPADDNENVGSVYEVGIDGEGYMLIDSPDGKFQYRRQTVQLDPQRLATGDTPFDESVERYNFIGYGDWTGGEGQLYLSRSTSDPSRYFYSEGINPFEMGQISCLPDTDLLVSDTFADPQIVVTSTGAFVMTAADELTKVDFADGATTAFDPGLGGSPTAGTMCLASDGSRWYITDGDTIRRNTAAADPGSDWSTENVTHIAWCTDRLMGLDTVGREVISFDDAGTGTVLFTHSGYSLTGLCGGDGYVWYGKNLGLDGEVRYWQVDSSPTVSGSAFELPKGESVGRLFFYLGNVFVAANSDDGNVGKIYRCIPSEGRLTPELIVDDLPFRPYNFAGRGRFVAFGWQNMQRTDENGIGVYDLESGGVARWYAGTSTAASTRVYVAPWRGDFLFSVGGEGLRGRLDADIDEPTYVSGFLETSTADLETSVFKYLDTIIVTCQPLLGEVEVSWSVDSNESWNSAGTFDEAGSTTLRADDVGVSGSTFGFRLDLTPDAEGTPIVTLLKAKTHPRGLVDQVLTLPINCADHVNGLNGNVLPESGAGAGILRVGTLEALMGRAVTVQDVDWPVTGASNLFQVISCDVTSTGTFSRLQSRRQDHAVCVITLRRPV